MEPGHTARNRATQSDSLTVVVLTKNEARDLPRCLKAIPERYPIVVVDSGSTDDTREIAREWGALVVEHDWPGFAAQRNFALNECRIGSAWVLFVDADEVYGEKFFDWFERSVLTQDLADVFMVPSYLFLNGRKLKYAPGYPIVHPRLVRRAVTSFIINHTNHGESVSKDLRVLQAPIAYDNYFFRGTTADWMRRHINLATMETRVAANPDAALTTRGKVSIYAGQGVLRVPLRFLYHYVVRGGFLDGYAGFQYSLMYTWYEMTKILLLKMPAEARD